ncbi:aminopeptidase M1 [Wolffia australiana]
MAEKQSVNLFKGQPRLPKFAIPRRYDLKLKPDLLNCEFAGTVRVEIAVVGDTKFLVLNAVDLVVADGSVSFRTQDSSEEWHPVEIVYVAEDEILVLEFERVLPLGKGVLQIGFSGSLNDQMKGFYRSTYEHDGVKKNMAVTQFEPADARRCFPCWDEPAFKAKFKITLEVPHDLVALSNMPVTEEKLDGPVRTLFFEESPVMSTYLVAVVVGLFDYVEDTTSSGTKVRVYCQVGKSSQGTFALDVAVRSLDLFARYFCVPYSLPKLDMVAIPDFSAGAMENYGLVTYRETALLYDECHSTAANKQRVAVVVAHELAHQWFGNLVTMEWWTHLWLNEGFATWVSYLAVDSLFPEWQIWTQFLDETTEGLRLDALEESHPIEVDINHASEIEEIFDAISYKKGASVIRMLHSYLGAECFQRSLASYINKYACRNAKTEDLWSVLEEESGEPVKTLMNSWTKQKGYPVVSVKIKENSFECEQSQFLSSGSSGAGQWMVPITVCWGSYSSQTNFLLKSNTENILISEDFNKLGNTWVKLNVNQTGFYRVKYDADLAARLQSAIQAKQLSVADRFGILDDSYALCTACKLPLSSLLSLMGAFRTELEYTVLSQLISISYKVLRIVSDAVPELVPDLKRFFINLFQISAKKMGWEPKSGESHLDAMLRGELLAVLAMLGHDSTRDEALKRFFAFMEDRSSPSLPPDTRKAAYVVVMRNADRINRSGYESLLKVYRETDLSQEKTRILSSLSSCPDPEMILEVLNFLLSTEVRSQDVIFGLAGVSSEGREIAWQWLKDNWEHISKTWGYGFLIGRFISCTVSPFSSEEMAKEVTEFFATRSKPAIARTLKQSIERIGINANWVQHIRLDDSLSAVLKALASAE